MDHQLRELLRKQTLRTTTARQTVFSVLKGGPALTTAELRNRTAGRLDTASLYRTLKLFRSLGVVQDVVVAGRRKIELTDAFSPHHHHISCTRCNTMTAIHDDAFERQITRLATTYGFTHESHSFEITGLCPACVRKVTAGGRSALAA